MLELPVLIEEHLRSEQVFSDHSLSFTVASHTVRNLLYAFLQGKVYFSALPSFVCIAGEPYHPL